MYCKSSNQCNVMYLKFVTCNYDRLQRQKCLFLYFFFFNKFENILYGGSNRLRRPITHPPKKKKKIVEKVQLKWVTKSSSFFF